MLAQLTNIQLSRFWSKVNKDGPTVRPDLTPCWVWTGSKTTAGYGNLTIDYKTYYAHRVIVFIVRDIQPADGEASHSCDNRICVNPDHVIIDDHSFNMNGCLVRGRMKHAIVRGIYHPHVKLNDQIVENIRTTRHLGSRKLAKLWGVHRSTIMDILHYRTWRNPSEKGVGLSIAKK